ncbi:dihydrolipoamide dehydrogenase [Actinomadura rubteroloni]|uniref:Dihydrolipoamide dehydrogenase n=1 Tax=Actinomadura rubteroloni TaxID=1926885 RepID=A0A2P4UM48_9ACTN|nr:FAD-dependent oxidoreductase [Actinomadura rubteroloni]POM26124.1 dihydrolipoamide dehydrogenase [Actinomadura rubteroloni]
MTRIGAVVVGAGPYGLSAAAHLRERGVETRLIGTPMQFWDEHMPLGMCLKSEPFASSLGAPRPGLAFPDYAPDAASIGDPVPLDVFTAYGRWFAERAAPTAEVTRAERIEPDHTGYRVVLATGETVRTASVVVAVGVGPFAHIPGELTDLPAPLVSHSSDHRDLGAFRDRDVVVVGAGQSALETAVLLAEQGARPTLVARTSRLMWNTVPHEAGGRLPTAPLHGLGRGWRTWLWSERPATTRLLPYRTRRRIVATTLGPAGAWWLRDRFDERVRTLLGHRVTRAREDAGRAVVFTQGPDGPERVTADHVIAATGFVPDLDRIPALAPALRAGLARWNGSPRLDRSFQSSAPDLYFAGLAAAASFGPVMRFVHGTDFAASRLARAIASRTRGPRPTDRLAHV